MIYSFLLSVHLIVSILLVIVILLQSSKGGGLAGSAFGGGASTAFLGARGTATFLSRATTVLAVIFMLNSLGLSFMLGGTTAPVSVTQQAIQTEASNLPRVADEFGSGLETMPLQTLPGTTGGTGELPATTTTDTDNGAGSETEQSE